MLLILFFIAIKGTPLTEMVAMIAMAAGCLGGTVAAFASAWRRKLVSIQTVLGTLAVYVLLLAFCFFAWGERINLLGVLLILGLFAVPLAPLAAAPLALAWNRHR